MDTWDKTHDAEKSTGWCPAVIDTNGDGKITAGWTEPDQPVDPTKDHASPSAATRSPSTRKTQHLVLGHRQRAEAADPDHQGQRTRRRPAAPRSTSLHPARQQPSSSWARAACYADSNGVVYDAWRVSGHFTAFDRSKCKSTKDPKADGQSCPEGWTIYRNTNEPTYANSQYKAGESYLLHMDKWDTLGFGKDAPVLLPIPNTDSLEVFQPSDQAVHHAARAVSDELTSPAPASGRIDDPNTGWKGKGFWSSYSTYASWHIEGGRARCPRWSSSRCGPIRWRSKRSARDRAVVSYSSIRPHAAPWTAARLAAVHLSAGAHGSSEHAAPDTLAGILRLDE